MKKPSNNPVELLIISGLFLVIGGAMMYKQVPVVITGMAGQTTRFSGSGMSIGADGEMAVAIGFVGILIGLSIAAFYIKLKREIDRQESDEEGDDGEGRE